MFCPKCGKTIKDGYEFCMSCGTKIENISDEELAFHVQDVELAIHSPAIPKKAMSKKIFIIAGVAILLVAVIGLFVQQFISTAKYNERYNDMVELMYFESYEVTTLAVGKLKYALDGDNMVVSELLELLEQQERITAANEIVDEQIELLRQAPIIFKRDLELFNDMYEAFKKRTDLEGSAWSAASGHDDIASIMEKIVAVRPDIDKKAIDDATIKTGIPKAKDTLIKYGYVFDE